MDAAAPGKVKVKVQAEFWIDPLDHVPLAGRRAMLLAGGRVESPGSFPTCGVDAALKQVTPRILMEVFMSELALVLNPLSTHGRQKQIVTESSSRCCLKNGQSSGEQVYDGTFADRRSTEIQNGAFILNFEPVQMSSVMDSNYKDRHPFEDCRLEDSQPHVRQCSYVVPCFALNGAGCDDLGICRISEQDFTHLENDVKGHDAAKLNAGNKNIDTQCPSEKHVPNSSEVNAEHIALPPSEGGRLSSIGVNNQTSLRASNLQMSEGCNDVNSDRACGAENIAAVSGLQKLSSSRAKKWLSDSILSTDPVRMKHKFSDDFHLSEESAAKRICTSTSVYSESYVPKQDSDILSDACVNNFSAAISNLPEKDVQSPAVGQEEEEFKTDSRLHGSFSSASTVMVKVEPADEDADARLSDTDALSESHLLPPSPSIQGTLWDFICQVDDPFVAHNLQENHEHGCTCSQETSTNHCKMPLVAEREVSFGTENQPCISALSFSHDRVKVEATEENSNNRVPAVNAVDNLCDTVLRYQEGSVNRPRGDPSKENCDSQALGANDANHVCTSVFDSRENSVPVNPYTVAEILSKNVCYKQNVSSGNDLQGNQRWTVLSYRIPEAVVKGKNCGNGGNQSSDGSFSFSPGRVKAEPLEQIHAVCSSETTTATKVSTLTFDSSHKFEGDHCQATPCSISNVQTFREGNTMCSDRMSANLPADSNLRDVFPDSVLSAFPKTVSVETLKGNCVATVSEMETTVNFCACASESSDKAVGMDVCAGMPVGEEQQICSNMTGLLPNSALSMSPMRVKDEPLEENHVVGDSESMSKRYSSLPIFDSPINAVVLNRLPDRHCSSKAIKCLNDSPSGMCNVQNTQETIMTSSQISIPKVTGIVTGQKRTCTANQHGDSDVSASDMKSVEQVEERCANIVSENTVGTSNSAYPSSNLVLKSEPVASGIQDLYSNPLGRFSSSDMLLIEAKSEIVDELSVDMLDLMPLTERTKLLAANVVSALKPARKSRCFKQTRVHAVGCDTVDSLKVKAKNSTHRRKRKKTATDSVEIALEEDAPGLLQGLLDRGINLDEIKLYGCEEDVGALDISPNEDSFEDLEAVISKLFFERPTSLFKLAPLRPAKGTKAMYCLACLISLIEQTRYLQFRNCPVEWGWCRDLQSFIFVFKMHNRIVLERPEYGYATYFFELVESFPIDWQIKRLVTAMKLTSCSRATLIENKSLLVGVDLSEGEARVLEEYGWQPNTGLGSMLNYCDRVVHDRNERDTSEWRLRIGKLLMDGYDGGCIVKADLPRKVVDYVGNHYPAVKMETRSKGYSYNCK